MKKVRFLSLMLISVLISACFVSCSSDDDQSVRSQLVGLWETSMSSSNWRRIEIKADGTLLYCVGLKDGKPNYDDVGSARWSFNEKDQTISMYTDDGYYAFTYKVSMATNGKSWAGYSESSGKTFSFTKIEY